MLTNLSIRVGCRPIVFAARAGLWDFTFVGIAYLLQDNCQKTLDMAQENVLTIIKFLLSASG